MNNYEGYTNYSTWNVSLWVDNEYNLYKAKIDALRDLTNSDSITADWAKELYSYLLGGSTPDLSPEPGCSWDDIDWEQLADELTIELKELVANDH